MARRKPSETKPQDAETTARADEFLVGKSEFRVGRPEFRIGDPNPGPPTEFRVGTPLPPTDEPKARPDLPKGWAHVPTQPPWRFPDAPAQSPSDDLQRIENPKKRYRGLAALKAYLDPDHVEEIIDLLVYRAQAGEPGPGSISDFIHGAVKRELTRRRTADGIGDRYPTYGQQGIRLKRGTRPGEGPRDATRQAELKPIVARLPEALVAEARDCVIHRNGGTRDGSNTVSQLVSTAVTERLRRERKEAGIARFPTSTLAERREYLDRRVLRREHVADQ